MKLRRYLKPYWLLSVLSPLFMLGEVLIDLALPTLMSQIVDDGVLGGNMQLILSTGLIMLVLAILGGLFGIGGNAFGASAAQCFGNDLRVDVFDRIIRLSPQQTDTFTTGSLVTRLTNDITAVQDMVSMALRMLIRGPMQFIGGIVMALALDVRFGLVLVVAMPIQIALIGWFIFKGSPLFSRVQSKLDKVNAVVQENITGARVVKAYVREDYASGRFKRANDDLVGTTLRVQKLMAILNPLMMIVMNLSVIAIIILGGYQAQAQSMQVGQIMAAITYITQILMTMMMISMMILNFTRAKASGDRIREVLNTRPALTSGQERLPRGGGSVSLRGVAFHYPNGAGEDVLRQIDLDVAPGETVAILGATGSGKTSLVGLIPRFYDATAGQVLLDGVDVKRYDLKNLREKVSYVLQKSELFSGTIAENIRWGKADATNEQVRAAARIAQADDFIQEFQNGYDTVISEKGTSLSGGQKQRLSIARAIVKQPEVLIFDDSTSALDLSTEAKLQKALREHLKGTTIIMIAQRVASVMGADRIVVLDNGRIADSGTHAELLERSALYQDIYYSQIRKEGAEIA
ncbi:MAG: ABC transporter ATP-binding protein [Christensenellales bacterium]|jgi:ATP-binding cassette subfamily B multidrug efflux pump